MDAQYKLSRYDMDLCLKDSNEYNPSRPSTFTVDTSPLSIVLVSYRNITVVAIMQRGFQGEIVDLTHLLTLLVIGHDILMATMLNGAAVMDAALLLVAANESCPQPQTSEHLAAIEIMKLEHIIILQNKVDLIKESAAQEHYQSILQFVKGTIADSAPIVPISAQLKYNIDAVNEYIIKRIPIPVRDFTSDPRLIVIRSFDVNKPGAEVDSLTGGIAGGSILSGVLKLGDEIEIPLVLSQRITRARSSADPSSLAL